MKNTAGWLLAALLVGGATAGAAEFWEKKKYIQWSETDVHKMLTDSPWARQHIEAEVHIDPLEAPPVPGGAPTGDSDIGLRAREQNPRLTYQFQIRSALPIRQALVRRAQLQQGYDRLPAEEKQTLDQQAGQFLAKEFPDQVVIHVSFESNIDFDQRELARHWQTQTTEKLRNTVYLIGAKGVKAQLQEFVLADGSGQAFQFTFPRTVEGQALAAPQDKELQLEFIHPDIRGRGEKRVLVKFKINKMMVDSQLEY